MVARAACIKNHVTCVTSAAQGATSTTTITHPDGRVEVRTERQPGEWRASKFMLAVRDPENFSETYIAANRAMEGAALPIAPVAPVEHDITTPEGREAAIAELVHLPADILLEAIERKRRS